MTLVCGRTLEQWCEWLKPLDTLPLECDGMTRVLSALLARSDIAHRAYVGSLEVRGVGSIPLHFWIELHDGHVCDLRARMWLGSAGGVPHGVFIPTDQVVYAAHHELEVSGVDWLFGILTGRDIAQIPCI